MNVNMITLDSMNADNNEKTQNPKKPRTALWDQNSSPRPNGSSI